MTDFIQQMENHHDKAQVTQTKLFINGEFIESDEMFVSMSPVTEKKIATLSLATDEHVDNAVTAAESALQGPWGKMDASRRAAYLFRLADLIDKHTETLARLEAIDSGKPFKPLLEDEIPLCAQTLRYYAGWADKIMGETMQVNGPYMSQTQKEPMGVCALIIPWNYPLLMAIWKLGPALAAGCTVILKPAEQTSLSALYLCQLFQEAEFPKGVFNCLSGFGADSTGEALVRHPGVHKIAFTGEGKTAERIKTLSAHTAKRLSFELGGKSPNIILADADFEDALNASVSAIFSNMGQNCCAGSRTFVHEDLYARFVEGFIEKAKRIKVGCPFNPLTTHGPQIDKNQFAKIMRYIEIGQAEGAECVAGGERFGDCGYFIKPTVFSHVTNDMCIAREEIFGPVACLIPFSDENDVIAAANDTPFGLASAVWTRDIYRANQFIKALKAGTVWVNCYNVVDYHAPFGGYKASGSGRELGRNALDLYLETKTVTIKT